MTRPDPTAEYQVGDAAPDPNGGNTGSIYHWWTIQHLRDYLLRHGYADVRTDQVQVKTGPAGSAVVAGLNRPDIQAVRNGRRVVIEVDTNAKDSDAHRAVVTRTDPSARAVYIVIDPDTGAVLRHQTYNPATGRTTTRERRIPASGVPRPLPPKVRRQFAKAAAARRRP